MRPRLILVLGLLCAVVLLGWTPRVAAQNAAAGQTRPRLQCQQNFKAMDTDHNGQVSEQEFMAFSHRRANAAQMFQTMAQGKGYITENEFCAGKGGGRGRGQGRGGKRQGGM